MSGKGQLTQLNREIEAAEAESKRLGEERVAATRDEAAARRRLKYLRLASWFRRPAAHFEYWRVAVLVVGPAVLGALLLIGSHLVLGSYFVALVMFFLGLAGGAAGFAALLYRPSDSAMHSAIAESESHCRLAAARLNEKNARLADVHQRLLRLRDERREQVASGRLQRAALLQRDWKSMQGSEWDDFVVEVCRTLEASVERLSPSQAEGPHLIAQFGDRRIAVFTRGEGHNVSSATIQQALAARERHRCNSCAVIINRRFTGAAQDFAQRHGCAAIGAPEFPDFVLGNIEL
jgi:hypothetical protein